MAQYFRAALFSADSWVYRRHHHALSAYPWCLLAIADSRLSEEAEEAIAHRFYLHVPAELPPGFARRLRSSICDWKAVLPDSWKQFFFGIGVANQAWHCRD